MRAAARAAFSAATWSARLAEKAGVPAPPGRTRASANARATSALPSPIASLVRRHIERLAGEAGEVDVGVGGDDDEVRLGDLLRRQGVLGADRPLGLDLDGMAERLGPPFDAFGGHEGVGDAGRTGRHRHDLLAGGGGEGAAKRCGRVRKRRVEGGAHRLLALEAPFVLAVADEQDGFGAGDRVRPKSARDGLSRSQFDGERMTER